MKSLFISFLIAGVFLFLVSGCKKSDDATPAPVTPQTLNGLKAPETFSWTTGQTVEVDIKGLPTVIEIKNTLKICLLDGKPQFIRFHRMDQDLKLKLIIPCKEKQLKITYGSRAEIVDIKNGVVNFSFIPNVSE